MGSPFGRETTQRSSMLGRRPTLKPVTRTLLLSPPRVNAPHADDRKHQSVFQLYSVRGFGTPLAEEVRMAAVYSMDLRARVLKDADAGLLSKELAERYHVSRTWVDALKERRET